MQEHYLPPAIFLMGPTASGKTELSVQLAEKYNAEIISVDSALVYKGMDIGTAKPSDEEKQGIPHHLIDILDPSESYSTGRFRESALSLMAEITKKNKIPLLTGGTMLYFNSLTKGLARLPEASLDVREKLNQELALNGKTHMHDRLKTIDPESALRIHPNDPQRVQRALEVYELSGKPISEFFHQAQNKPIPYRLIKVIISPEDRKELHEKIAKRFHLMLQQGLIDEVNVLFQRNDLSESLPSIRSVGYRQVWRYLKGEYNQDIMIEKAIVATRQLAKRQLTWLRKEQDVLQFDSTQKDLYDRVYQTIQKTL